MRGHGMKRFIDGADPRQSTLFPERFEDYIGDDNPVRAIDVFVDSLDLGLLGFNSVVPEATGRPGYHPATLLKIYIYGYLNQVSHRTVKPTQEGRDAVRASQNPPSV